MYEKHTILLTLNSADIQPNLVWPVKADAGPRSAS